MPIRLSPSACLIALAIVVLVGAAIVWAIGSKLIAVDTRPVALPGLGAEDVVLRAAPDQRVAGSYLAGRGRGAALLLWQLPLRLNIRPDALRPIAYIAQLKAPVLIAAGGADLHTTLPETQRLFAAAAEPKALWVVEGAAHGSACVCARGV
jgi:fermentation-respiration switch protein FrsA (DUF1100 family)